MIAEVPHHFFGVQVQIWNDNGTHSRNWLIGELGGGII